VEETHLVSLGSAVQQDALVFTTLSAALIGLDSRQVVTYKFASTDILVRSIIVHNSIKLNSGLTICAVRDYSYLIGII